MSDEKVGTATTVCDLSGKPLTAAPRWAWSAGGEYAHDVPYLNGQLFVGVEASYRSKMSGDPSASAYTVIDAYTIVNLPLVMGGGRAVGSFLLGEESLRRGLHAEPHRSGGKLRPDPRHSQ